MRVLLNRSLGELFEVRDSRILAGRPVLRDSVLGDEENKVIDCGNGS